MMILALLTIICAGVVYYKWDVPTRPLSDSAASRSPTALTRPVILPQGVDLLDTSISEISGLLNDGTLSSEVLVGIYLDNIEADNHRGLNLRAVIDVAPRQQVLDIARGLDKERKEGHVRSKLHGIPILVKWVGPSSKSTPALFLDLRDPFSTHKELGMRTTAGSLAFEQAYADKDAFVVAQLRKAGAIVIAKTNLNELSGFKSPYSRAPDRVDPDDPGDFPWNVRLNAIRNATPANPPARGETSGYSAIGGQTSSAYVFGGFDCGGDPLGSSSGSAVGLSAGWWVIALGTDTTGSVIGPASRAALFGIRTTAGLLSRWNFDTPGIMSFSTLDLAIALEVAAKHDPDDLKSPPGPTMNYTSFASNPPPLSTWSFGVPTDFLPELEALQEPYGGRHIPLHSSAGSCPLTVLDKTNAFIDELIADTTRVVRGTDMRLNRDDYTQASHLMDDKLACDFKESFDAFAPVLGQEVRSVEALINFNDLHADAEMPRGECCQEDLVRALASDPQSAHCVNTALRLDCIVRQDGLDYIFKTYDIDAILVSLELGHMKMHEYAGAAGYPAGVVPFDACSNGLPFGTMVIVPPWQESRLLSIMASLEAYMPKRKLPQPMVAARKARNVAAV